MLELATRARDPLVRKALIRALNEAQPHVKELKNSPDAKRIEKYMRAYDAQQAIAGVSSEGGEDTEEIARAPKRRRLRSPSRADDQPAEEADAEASDDEEEGEEERPVRRGEREDLRELMADFSLNVAELKKRLGSLTHEEQARFSFDDWLTWRMCQIDDAKVFTEKDLEDDAILERALRLLYLARIGRPNDLVLGRIHIDYDALPLEQKLAADRQKQHFAIDRDGRLKMRNLIDYGR